MEELLKDAVLTSAITVCGGVLVFVGSQYFLKIMLDPVLEFKRTLYSISATLLAFQETILNYNFEQEPELATRLKSLSVDLLSRGMLIPFCDIGVIQRLFDLPEKGCILPACHSLNKLSYSVIANESCGKGSVDIIQKNEQLLLGLSENLKIKTTYLA